MALTPNQVAVRVKTTVDRPQTSMAAALLAASISKKGS